MNVSIFLFRYIKYIHIRAVDTYQYFYEYHPFLELIEED